MDDFAALVGVVWRGAVVRFWGGRGVVPFVAREAGRFRPSLLMQDGSVRDAGELSACLERAMSVAQQVAVIEVGRSLPDVLPAAFVDETTRYLGAPVDCPNGLETYYPLVTVNASQLYLAEVGILDSDGSPRCQSVDGPFHSLEEACDAAVYAALMKASGSDPAVALQLATESMSAATSIAHNLRDRRPEDRMLARIVLADVADINRAVVMHPTVSRLVAAQAAIGANLSPRACLLAIADILRDLFQSGLTRPGGCAA